MMTFAPLVVLLLSLAVGRAEANPYLFFICTGHCSPGQIALVVLSIAFPFAFAICCACIRFIRKKKGVKEDKQTLVNPNQQFITS
jgi:hypothetical protein